SGPQPLRPTVRRVVRPGQSLTLTANWTATTTGTFTVNNQLAPHGPFATFSVAASQSAPPVSPPVPPVSPPVPPVSPPIGTGLDITLTTDKASYTVGQVVHMSVTATNDTDHDVALWVGPNSNVFSITQNGQVIWQSNSGPQPLNATALKVL